MTKPMIAAHGLVKTFESITAVGGVSFNVAKGEVLGFLGPNGAGKSTTMKMITGFLTPTEGRVEICGYDMARDAGEARAQIGYLPEGAPAYGDMTPAQFLDFIARVRGFKGDEKQAALSNAIARAQLHNVLSQPIDTLSKGFKRRVGLAQAILHDPPVLIMDEPTDGLDPNQKFAVRRLIAAMAKDKAIIISTHILEEVDAVCSRALIIDKGKIVADGTPQELAQKSRYHNAVILSVGPEHCDTARQSLNNMPMIADLVEEKVENGGVQWTAFPKEGARLIDEISTTAQQAGWDIRTLTAESGRLEEVFRNCTTSDASPQNTPPIQKADIQEGAAS